MFHEQQITFPEAGRRALSRLRPRAALTTTVTAAPKASVGQAAHR